MIKKRVLRTGDGSHPYSNEDVNNNNNSIKEEKLVETEHFWGFGDKEMRVEDMKYVKVLWEFADNQIFKHDNVLSEDCKIKYLSD